MSLHHLFRPSTPKFEMDILKVTRYAPLHAHQLEGAETATVLGKDGEVVAKQTLIKYSANQAYCSLTEISPVIAGKYVKVSEVDDDRTKLKLVTIEKERENRRLLPIVVQFHTVPEARPIEAHMTDRLAEETLGRNNLELKKNVTFDSFTYSDTWRDEAGFIVTDRNRYEYVTFDVSKLLQSLSVSSDVKISEYLADDLDGTCDFDNTVTGFNREKVIEFLSQNCTVLIAKNGNAVEGFLAGKLDKLCCLYAESEEIAHTLLKEYINKKKLIQINFFTKADTWQCEPSSKTPVYRSHTRAVPGSIKWSKIYALNMGMHIV
ncbi:unnamed protein product [Auanema sp. JU1783]|nr:unnamed protein product [Auanema sp. JU1783]